MKKYTWLLLLWFLLAAGLTTSSVSAQKLDEVLQSVLGADQIAEGLKEALKVGTENVVQIVSKLDGFYQKSPTMKAQPFADVLKTMMVMEYDWDQPGVDKEALAKKTLGDDLYTANKTRVGQAGQKK